MHLAIELVLAALAATRWATLLTRDSFGPIAAVRDWFEYRYPHAETIYRASVVRHEVVTRDTPEGPAPVGDRWFTDKGVEVMPHPTITGEYIATDPHPLGTLVTCVRCMSVWAGLVAMLAVVYLPDPALLAVLAPFAFSQVAITLTRAD